MISNSQSDENLGANTFKIYSDNIDWVELKIVAIMDSGKFNSEVRFEVIDCSDKLQIGKTTVSNRNSRIVKAVPRGFTFGMWQEDAVLRIEYQLNKSRLQKALIPVPVSLVYMDKRWDRNKEPYLKYSSKKKDYFNE